jgi:hypothetical protein
MWVTAAPLWKSVAKTPTVLRRPTILGFGHDNFMDELLGTLSQKPEGISDRVQTGPSLSYRERLPGEAYDFRPSTAQLKLYQPVHGWFYLVAGSLVCQLPGLPDHPVDLGNGEKASFVLRRLDGQNELALISDAQGKKSWQRTATPERLGDGEEVLPMFPLGFTEAQRRRKLLAGVIPAGSQDLFQSAPLPDDAPAGNQPGPADALEDVKGRVAGAIDYLQKNLSNAQVQQNATEISRFALLDLADFLTFYIPSVMSALANGTSLTGKQGALLKLLRNRTVDQGKSFADLLPTMLPAQLDVPFSYNLANSNIDASDPSGELRTALKDALEEVTGTAIDNIPVVDQKTGATRYVARLVYQRPACGPLHPDVVSPPTEPFLLAPYFDPDAPQRPIRISLPFDTSIKSLRQFRKNVKMVLSTSLQKAMNRKKINDNIDGPDVDCGGLELSIPIITIVAMIILFVFIFILNIVFFWIPFVKICLPKIKVEL